MLDDALRARLYARLAGDLIATNEVEQGERIFALCDEAAAAARRAGASGALAIALMGTHYVTRLGMRPARPGDACRPSRRSSTRPRRAASTSTPLRSATRAP